MIIKPPPETISKVLISLILSFCQLYEGPYNFININRNIALIIGAQIKIFKSCCNPINKDTNILTPTILNQLNLYKKYHLTLFQIRLQIPQNLFLISIK